MNTLRLVALGDSLAYGAGDESGGGIAGRIEHELRKRGVASVDTVNLGVNGAQTADLMARLRQQRVRNEIAKADAIVLCGFSTTRASRSSRCTTSSRLRGSAGTTRFIPAAPRTTRRRNGSRRCC